MPDDLIEANPRLIVTRVSGFGQDGPYAGQPGFATLAEAMSGFAGVNGEPDGGPLLPPIALTDEVTALVAAFATMVAVHAGVGQVVDVNLLESMLQMMGPLPSASALTRLRAASPRVRDPLHGAPQHLPVRRRPLGGGVHVVGVGGRTGDGPRRPGSRRALRHVRRPGRPPRRARRAPHRVDRRPLPHGGARRLRRRPRCGGRRLRHGRRPRRPAPRRRRRRDRRRRPRGRSSPDGAARRAAGRAAPFVPTPPTSSPSSTPPPAASPHSTPPHPTPPTGPSGADPHAPERSLVVASIGGWRPRCWSWRHSRAMSRARSARSRMSSVVNPWAG